MALYMVAIFGKADDLANGVVRLLDFDSALRMLEYSGRTSSEYDMIQSIINESHRDLSTRAVIQGLKDGLKIENLELKDGKLKCLDCSIKRYEIYNTDYNKPKYTDDVIITIINKLTDSKGNVLRYQLALSNGIVKSVTELQLYGYMNGCIRVANGKLVKKDEYNSYISAINREFNTITKKGRSTEVKYAGDELDMESINTLEIETTIVNMQESKFKLLVDRNNKIVELTTVKNVENIEEKIKYKYGLAYYDDIAIIGDVVRKLTLSSSIAEIRKLLRLKQSRETIDKNIKTFETYVNNIITHTGRVYEKDSSTGLYMHKSGRREIRYKDVILVRNLKDSLNDYEDISDSEINKYIRYLKVMKCRIMCSYRVEDRKVALKRKRKRDGIDYTILYSEGSDGRYFYGSVRIEDVFEDIDSYCNIERNEKEIIIRGIDGVYRFNEDKINDTYKRNKIETVMSVKADMIDAEHNDYVDGNGVLKNLSSSLEILKVPNEATSIASRSINIGIENRRLIIGNNIKKSSAVAFRDVRIEESKVISIGCADSAGENILKSIGKIYINGRGGRLTLEFDKVISHKELGILCTLNNVCCDKHKVRFKCTDKFIIDALKHSVVHGLYNLEVLKDKMVVSKDIRRDTNGELVIVFGKSAEFIVLGKKIQKLKSWWTECLRHKSSETVKVQGDKILKAIMDSYNEKDKEFNKLVEAKENEAQRLIRK